MSNLFIIFIILAFSKVIPMVVGIINWRYLDSRTVKMVIYYILSTILEGLALTLVFTRGINLFMTHIGALMEIVLVSTVLMVPSKSKEKRIVYITAVCTAAVAIVLEVVIKGNDYQSYDFINSIGAGIGAITLSIFALISLFDLRYNSPEPNLSRLPMFWISTGTLLYFSTGIIIFSFSQTLLEVDQNMTRNVFLVHVIIYLFMNILCTIGFSKAKSLPNV